MLALGGGNARGIRCPQAKRDGCRVYKEICTHASLIERHATTVVATLFSLREAVACNISCSLAAASIKPVLVLIGGLSSQPRAEAFVCCPLLPCSPRCPAVHKTGPLYCDMSLVSLSDSSSDVVVEIYACLAVPFSVTCSCLLNGYS
jgi:hypothetical protein